MNQLTEFLVNSILEEDKKEIIGIFGGGFKPPIKGHVAIVEKALQDFPELDKLIVSVGSGVRDEIDQEESLLVWDIYQRHLPMKVEIGASKSGMPIKDIYKLAKENPDKTIYWFIGAREGREDDLQDIAARTKSADKYGNLNVKVITTSDPNVSGTNARKALLADDKEKFFTFLPSFVTDEEKEEIYTILRPAVKEQLNEGIIDISPEEEAGLKQIIDQYIIPALINRTHNQVLHKASYTLSNGEKGKVGFYVYNDPKGGMAHFVANDYKSLDDQLIGVNAYYYELPFAGGLERIYTTLTGDTPYEDLLSSIRHEYIHAKDPGANDEIFSARQRGPELSDYYASWVEFPAQTGELLLSIKNNLLNFAKKRLTTNDTEYLSKVLQDILDFYSGNKRKLEDYTLDFFNSIDNSRFQKFMSKVINFGGDVLGIATTPTWTKSDSFSKFFHKLNMIKKHNPEGFKEFQKDLYKLIQSQIEQINKGLAQGVKPIYAGGKNRLNEHSMGSSIDLLPYLAKLTQHMIDKGYNIEPLPGLELIDDDVENAENFFGNTAYYNPNTQTIVLYTHGRHPKDIARSYAHEMIHHIQNLEGRLGNITTTNTQEDDYLNDLEAEANLNGTMTFRNWTDSITEEKKNKDPFGLNQFARELMTEGAYDALTTKLTKATINKWVEDSKKKPMPKKSFVDIDIDEFDGKGREIEFNYVGIVEFDKKIDGYEVDGTSNSGEDKGKMPFVATMFRINPKILPQAWSKISADVSDVIRHEIEHLTQAGDNVRGQVYDDEGNLIDKGKYMDDDIMIRDMINKLKILPKSDYYKLEKEVDAMLQGLYLKAKKTRKPFADVVDQYLDIAPGIDTKEDKEAILNLWRSRRKALSLPVFENEEKVMDYKIFLDMDGVLVNFDEQFQELTGMMPREFESKYSTEKFWEEIESAGVGFWRGMKWMPGGEALYNRASKFDHALLSSPSKSETSKIGKRLWRRDKTPDTKLILARSYNKRKYAAPNHILIDDREDNIQQWRDAGGIGILYKSADQVNAELDKLGL